MTGPSTYAANRGCTGWPSWCIGRGLRLVVGLLRDQQEVRLRRTSETPRTARTGSSIRTTTGVRAAACGC